MLPNRVKGGYYYLQVGDGADPEVFTTICGLNTRSFTAQLNTNDDFVKDCADPEAIPVRVALPTGRQWDISGSGVIDRDNIAALVESQGITQNYRFIMGAPDGTTGFTGYWEGPGILTNIQFGGNDDAFATLDVTIISDGEWALVDEAA